MITSYWNFNSLIYIKGIVSDSNNIFIRHESEDVNKKKNKQTNKKINKKQNKTKQEKSIFPKFQLIPILCFQVMHDCVCFIAPIDYGVE